MKTQNKPVCEQKVDTSMYTKPCSGALPLDSHFINASKMQNGGGYYSKLSSKIGGLPEIVSYSDCNKQNTVPQNISNSLESKITNNQKGGAYSKIVNPLTGRKVSIFGRLGKKILKNYIKYGGDGESSMSDAYIGKKSVYNPNMDSRKFDCNQPNWEPSCI